MNSHQHLHLITGKGGVGKTTVATSMAMALAKRGQRVLLAEINGGGHVPGLLGMSPVGYSMREIFDNLFVMDITSQEALKEYVLLVIRIEALYNAVFKNKLVSSFLRLLPALGELTMLGKIWYELQQLHNNRKKFDAVVVDLPATGHARVLLQAPQAVGQSIGTGPMKDNADKLDAMVKDVQHTTLHVVTLAEEMPITEAQELYELTEQLPMNAGPLIVNRWPQALSPQLLHAVDLWHQDPALHQLPELLHKREARRQRAEALLHKRLPAWAPNAIALPHLMGRTPSHEALLNLGERILQRQPQDLVNP